MIRIFRTLFGLLSICLAVAQVSAANPPVPAPQPPVPVARKLDPARTELDSGVAMHALEKCKNMLLKIKVERTFPPPRSDEKDALVNAIEIANFAGRLEFISKTFNLEEDTKCSRKWYQEICRIVEGFVKVKQIMEDAVDNRDKERYLKACDSFERGQKILKDLIDKPVKLTADQLAKVREQNDIIRAKIKAEQKRKPN